jgi:methyl acetate hydrolase
MNLERHLDELLGRATRDGSVPGVVAMVTRRDGTIYEGAFGQRVLGRGPAMTVDTVGWIASLTKAVTSAAAMQLVERGRLDLDVPAHAVVPAIAQVQVLTGFDGAGRPQLRPPGHPITLRHLLTHTAGFGYEMWNRDMRRVQAALGLPGIAECRNASLLAPLLFDPGERWNYGIGVDWAGRMVEAASGKALGEAMRDSLFTPLGMGSTAFGITAAMRARLAKLHQRGDDGDLTAVDQEANQAPEFESGGGGLYSTAADYLKFVRMILNGGAAIGARVLRPQTVALMSRNQIGGQRVTPLKTAIPRLSNDAEFFPGVAKTWGLSFQINAQPAPTGRPAGGLMWAGLSNVYYWIDPVEGLAGVFLTQILPFADAKALPLYYAFETAVYDSLR